MSEGRPRPTSVTVIGWLSIGLAAFMMLSAGMGLFSAIMIEQATGGQFPKAVGGAPGMLHVVMGIFRYFKLLAAAQLVVAAAVIIAGIRFLALRAWARTALEVFYWVSLLYVVGFGSFWLISWVSAVSQIPATEQPPIEPAVFSLFGIVMGLAVMLMWAVPLGVVIWVLRGRTVREATAGRQ